MALDSRPIGIMDSGIGGLSVLREVRRQLPNENVLYFADQSHVPYGPRSAEEIIQFLTGITRFFLSYNVKAIVIACNTASAAGLHAIRALFPDIHYVGMEPAVKPAAEHTQRGVIGVIATKTTSQSALFASVIDRFASDVSVVTQVCPDFVTLVEAGDFDSPAARQTAENYLRPLKEAGMDELVLGCTHFAFLIPTLRDVAGPDVEIVDPSPAVARQVGRVIANKPNSPDHPGSVQYYTSGDPAAFLSLARRLMDEPIDSSQVHALTWHNSDLVPATPESKRAQPSD